MFKRIEETEENKGENFGLVEGTEYKYDDAGFIDWRKMIPDKYFYIKKSSLNKNPKLTVKEAEDKDLVILLGGIRYVATLRGLAAVEHTQIQASDKFAWVDCQIFFIPNCEDSNGATSSGVANASLETTSGFGQNYLVEMASNRAFCRAVRNWLRINIVSNEEISGGNQKLEEIIEVPETTEELSIHKELQKLVNKHEVFSLDKIKEVMEKENVDTSSWDSIESIPVDIASTIIRRIKSKVK